MKKDSPKISLRFCPEDISELDGIKEYINCELGNNAYLNKYNGPIWMDFSPGSYIDKNGEKVYTSTHKCEYVDKELIRIIMGKMDESVKKKDFNLYRKYADALNYFINN